MIIDKTDGYLDTVKASPEAKTITGRHGLEEMLKYLDTYADHERKGLSRCTVYKLYNDWAPLSFGVTMEKKNKKTGKWVHMWTGGLIYHDEAYGWNVHT